MANTVAIGSKTVISAPIRDRSAAVDEDERAR
jgi:hypothetical protein